MPENVVDKLRERAARHHRSMQGELMALICEATEPRRTDVTTSVPQRRRSGTRRIEDVAAVLFDEPDREAAALALAGKELFAPELLADELVSVAVKKSRQGLEEVVAQALVDFADLELTRCRGDVAAQWRLALDHAISAYDAAYLWLAAELRAPLATFDERLGAAARALLGAR